MSLYYDKNGKPMDMPTWSGQLGCERVIGRTTLPDGKWISTVWLGLNHRTGDGPPLIFESMVFPADGNMSELECRRYSTYADAKAGHDELIDKWMAKVDTEK